MALIIFAHSATFVDISSTVFDKVSAMASWFTDAYSLVSLNLLQNISSL